MRLIDAELSLAYYLEISINYNIL